MDGTTLFSSRCCGREALLRFRIYGPGTMHTDFYRIKRLPPYIFEEVNRLKAQARARGEDIIDFGMGNPDMPTPKHIVDKLVETARDPKSNRYSASRGIKGLRKASRLLRAPLRREAGSRTREVDRGAGFQGRLRQPGAGDHRAGRRGAGSQSCISRSTPSVSFWRAPRSGMSPRRRPRSISQASWQRRTSFACRRRWRWWSDYPSNPTAHVVGLDFYKEVVEFAKKHEIWVLSDLAYADIYFDDDNPPPSILQVEGAKDIAIEFQSLSKTYAMPGWRMGFAAGNKHLIGALGADQVLSGLWRVHADPGRCRRRAERTARCVAEIRAIYKSRRDVLVDSMQRAGWDILRRRHRCSPGRLCRNNTASAAPWNSPSRC